MGLKVADWYAKTKSLYSDSVQSKMGPTPEFKKDTEFLPLQASDALAWTTRRNNEGADKPCPLPIDVLQGFYEVPMLDWHWDRDRLYKFQLDRKDIFANIQEWKGRLKRSGGETKLGFESRAVFKR